MIGAAIRVQRDATELTADNARTLALHALAKVSTGVDIQADKKQAKRKQEQAKVAVLETFIEKRYGPWALLHKKSAHESLRVLNRDFKHLLRKPKGDVTLPAEITKSKKSRTFFLADEPLWVLSEWKKQTCSS